MKTYLAVFTILFFSLFSFGRERFAELPARFDGSMSLYDFSKVEERNIPDTLAPVHIFYIARHGARYLTSEQKVESVEKILKDVEKRGHLTERGRECLALLERIRIATSGQWGMLSPIGREEELQLGREIAEMFPEVFRAKDARLTGESSYVPRVIATMDNFFISITDIFQGISTSAASGHAYDFLTRFFVTDKVYDNWRKKGEWKEIYEAYAVATLPTGPAKALTGTKSGLSDKELRQLSYDLYKVLQGLRAMGLPGPSTQWMTPEEYEACWKVTNLEKYYQYSLSSMSSLPALGAQDVLFKIIDDQIEMENGRVGHGLYGIFGHAETLLPIFALLGVPGCTALPIDFNEIIAVR